jgi:hypothetical protein
MSRDRRGYRIQDVSGYLQTAATRLGSCDTRTCGAWGGFEETPNPGSVMEANLTSSCRPSRLRFAVSRQRRLDKYSRTKARELSQSAT